MSANIEGVRTEVSTIKNGTMKLAFYAMIILSAVAIPANAFELIKLFVGGGL